MADIAIVAGSLHGYSLAVAIVYKEADFTTTASCLYCNHGEDAADIHEEQVGEVAADILEEEVLDLVAGNLGPFFLCCTFLIL